jgi:hypothetical protein
VTDPSPVRSAARRPGGAGQDAHTRTHMASVRRDLDEIFDYRLDAVARILG